MKLDGRTHEVTLRIREVLSIVALGRIDRIRYGHASLHTDRDALSRGQKGGNDRRHYRYIFEVLYEFHTQGEARRGPNSTLSIGNGPEQGMGAHIWSGDLVRSGALEINARNFQKLAKVLINPNGTPRASMTSMRLSNTFPKVVTVAGGLLTFGLLLSPTIQADDYDKKTTVTFTAPVAIPPVHLQGWGTLPAGTYVFKLLNSSSNRHIVQIFNQDQTKIYATILAIPNYRLQAKDKTVMTFNEGIRGKPESLRAWFYPGANWGEEFVYPQTQAVELAKVVKQPVLAVIADVPVEVAKPEEPVIIAQLTQAPVKAVQPTGEVVELAQVVQTTPPPARQVTAAPAQSTAQTQTLVAKTLPGTAGSTPLILVFAVMALAGGFILRALIKEVFAA